MGQPISHDHTYTPQQYLELALDSEERLEYVDGAIVAMGKTTDTHGDLAFNMAAELKAAVKGRNCRVHMESISLEVEENGRYYLPDVMLTCDERDHADRLIKRYPEIVVEVLAEGSEARDRGEKFAAYLRMPSLKYYLLISQDRVRIEVYTKLDSGGWHFDYFESLESEIKLGKVGITLQIAQIYAGV